MVKPFVRGTVRESSRSALLPTITMGIFSSSLMRIISSRRVSSSAKDDGEVMLKTSRNPWPIRIYKSRIATIQTLVLTSIGSGTSPRRTKLFCSCCIEAVLIVGQQHRARPRARKTHISSTTCRPYYMEILATAKEKRTFVFPNLRQPAIVFCTTLRWSDRSSQSTHYVRIALCTQPVSFEVVAESFVWGCFLTRQAALSHTTC